MSAVLHSMEALPGNGRYAVTFRYTDGTSLTAVVHADDSSVTVAEASLPNGWTAGSAEYAALADAVLALHRARAIMPAPAELHDVDGGWDVMMGNVVLDASGVPACTAHGPMSGIGGDRYECAECGAKAMYAA